MANATTPRSKTTTEQNVRTPGDFLIAIERRFGPITFDLAADADSHVTANNKYFSPAQDSLVQTWPTTGVNWLNPPFGDIGPWVEKARDWVLSTPAWMGALTLVLIPASVDTAYWDAFVRGYARVEALKSRVKFVGHTQGFPKPLVLLTYDPRFPRQHGIVDRWDWKQS